LHIVQIISTDAFAFVNFKYLIMPVTTAPVALSPALALMYELANESLELVVNFLAA
jgi:hypothetical protein